MKDNYLNLQQESTKSGYTPNIQVTTGTYCVTMYSSQSSGKPYSDCSPEWKDEGGPGIGKWDDKTPHEDESKTDVVTPPIFHQESEHIIHLQSYIKHF